MQPEVAGGGITIPTNVQFKQKMGGMNLISGLETADDADDADKHELESKTSRKSPKPVS
jgi:hypothetical protein